MSDSSARLAGAGTDAARLPDGGAAATSGCTGRGLMLLRLVAALGAAGHLTLLLRPFHDFLARPFLEDAFYSLSVARSIGMGNGLTVDGVHPTNGVQPLICFLYAPCFTLTGGQTEPALRLAMIIQLLLFFFAVGAIARFTASLRRDDENGGGERKEIFWLMAAALLWNYTIPAMFLNGLETGLSTGLAFTAAWYYNAKIAAHDRPSLWRSAMLGAILGLAVLARIDIAFLVVAILVWHLYRMHRRHAPSPGQGRDVGALVRTLAECMLIGGIALAVSSPWWIYNATVFGSLVPISGQAQEMLIGSRLWVVLMTIHALSDAFLFVAHTSNIYFAGFFTIVVGMFLFALAGAVVMTVPTWRRAVGETASALGGRWRLGWLVPMALFSGGLILYYTSYFSAPHFQWRYLIVPRLLIMLGIVIFLHDLWRRVPARSGLRGMISAAMVAAAALVVVAYRGNFRTEWNNIFLVPGEWISAHVPPGESVGMFQSGTTGFLHPGTVVNLDGKVNADALRAFQRKRLPAYVDSMRFEYIIDWDFYTRNIFSDPRLRSHYAPIDTLPFEFIVWKRVDSSK